MMKINKEGTIERKLDSAEWVPDYFKKDRFPSVDLNLTGFLPVQTSQG